MKHMVKLQGTPQMKNGKIWMNMLTTYEKIVKTE